VVINLKKGEADQVILGETSWNELGKNTWIHSTPQDQSVQYLINL
jgi:flagellar assembly factor FliW